MHERAAAEAWISSFVQPAGPIEIVRERPWSTVLRVACANGLAWFKACGPAGAFEPRLTAELSARWPDTVAEVIAFDEQRAWLLLADAGTALRASGMAPEPWLEVLPRYAELQRGEASYAQDHLAHGVPSLLVTGLPDRYAEMLERDLPLDADEIASLVAFAPRLEQLCIDLADAGMPPTVQHDDLHMGNVYEGGDGLRLLDWGDSSISHPFFSLVVTLRFLEEHAGLERDDPWFGRLRDAYLEPWGEGLTEVFDLALQVGHFAHAIAWERQRRFIRLDSSLQPDRATFDTWFARVLRRALDAI